ncbi:hypothetical protein [Streptomyces syringium]
MEQRSCAACGISENTHIHAAARGWQTARHRLHCPTWARRFPTWMHKQI